MHGSNRIILIICITLLHIQQIGTWLSLEAQRILTQEHNINNIDVIERPILRSGMCMGVLCVMCVCVYVYVYVYVCMRVCLPSLSFLHLHVCLYILGEENTHEDSLISHLCDEYTHVLFADECREQSCPSHELIRYACIYIYVCVCLCLWLFYKGHRKQYQTIYIRSDNILLCSALATTTTHTQKKPKVGLVAAANSFIPLGQAAKVDGLYLSQSRIVEGTLQLLGV